MSGVTVFGKMSKIGCPLRFIAMVCGTAISDGMQALVQTDGGYSETLLVPDAVKQGCWLVGGFILNDPVNNFSVMLGRSHRFLGITSTFRE